MDAGVCGEGVAYLSR